MRLPEHNFRQYLSQVFRSANDQIPYIRIPALICTTSSVLLAFAERRMDGRHDQRRNHILIRRSMNGGRSWEPARVLVDFGQDFHANNPVAVQVKRGANAGRIILTVTRLVRNYGGDDDDNNGLGTNRPLCGRHYLTHSDDDGLTWSTPKEFSQLVRTDETKKVVAGPGTGIQIRWGRFRDRIVLPFSEADGIFAVWSDDGGGTWERGGLGPHFGRELEIAELSPRAGETVLLASVRNSGDRGLLESLDGGQTWTPRTASPLRDVGCHGSTISFSFANDGEFSRLVYSAPQSPNCDGIRVRREVDRKCGTIFVSNDEGVTWRAYHDFVHPSEEYFFYSSMCRLPNDRVGILFEAGGNVDNRVGPIIFKSFSISDIDAYSNIGENGWNGDIGASDGYIYLARNGELRRGAICDNVVTERIGGSGWNGNIAVDDGYVYLVRNGELRRGAISDNVVTESIGGSGWNGSIAVDDGYVYLARNGELRRGAISDNVVTESIGGSGWNGSIAVEGGVVYLATPNGTLRMGRVSSNTVTNVIGSVPRNSMIAVENTTLFFTSRGSLFRQEIL